MNKEDINQGFQLIEKTQENIYYFNKLCYSQTKEALFSFVYFLQLEAKKILSDDFFIILNMDKLIFFCPKIGMVESKGYIGGNLKDFLPEIDIDFILKAHSNLLKIHSFNDIKFNVYFKINKKEISFSSTSDVMKNEYLNFINIKILNANIKESNLELKLKL